MIRPLCLLLIAALAACAPAAVPPQGAAALAPSLPSATPASESNPADRADLAALIAEAVRLMTSPALRGNLEAVERQFGQIAQSGWGARLPAGRIADLIAGRDPAYTYFPVTVEEDPARESSTTDPWASWRISRIAILDRPSSTVTLSGISRMKSNDWTGAPRWAAPAPSAPPMSAMLISPAPAVSFMFISFRLLCFELSDR